MIDKWTLIAATLKEIQDGGEVFVDFTQNDPKK